MLHDEQRLLASRPPPSFAHPEAVTTPASDFWAPPGHLVDLPGRGTAFFREMSGPPGAPTVVLLHGWFASASVNWFQVFEPLSRQFRVIAPDLRGHGGGPRTSGRFRLTDCADDVAALLDQLGIGSAIMVGYSMGGPVAQLVWKYHRSKVDGLVLCATSYRLVRSNELRWPMANHMAGAPGTSGAGKIAAAVPRVILRRLQGVNTQTPLPSVVLSRMPLTALQRWTVGEMRSHDWRLIFQAGAEIGQYDARKWIRQVDVPTAVVITTRDTTVLPRQQTALACAIPDATMHRFDDNHFGYARQAFVQPIVAACTDVAARAYRVRSGRRGLGFLRLRRAVAGRLRRYYRRANPGPDRPDVPGQASSRGDVRPPRRISNL